ncbi:plasmid stabilization protein [Bosea sp. Tri-44]|nr:type II toxin-antitoxin system RelE/ParE family toxin [Bosea sp. Tri-44]RXT43008.1 plasmid stabilization protein [Bosea sp. Tri-44]
MVVYRIRLLPEAEADLAAIYDYIRDHASQSIAQGYVQRIMTYLTGFDTFPERGTRRDDIRPGLRIVGFERWVTIAFLVEGDEVIVSNVLYGGRELPEETGG